MRVLFCKIHCPSICFCKPSCHLYTPSTLKLENTPHAPPPPPPPPPLPPSPEANSLEERQALANGSGNGKNENCNGCASHLKSSLRKPSPESCPVEKKKVQWVDVLGKELAEIKEFESSEEGDHDYGRMDNRGCVCTIL